MIVGIDEVGRGAWAGPLCVGAVALGGLSFDGLTDSKMLSKKKRQYFSREIKQQAPLVGIGWVSAKDIDRIGMSQALKLAARRAMDQIDCPEVTQIIIDGTIRLIEDTRVTTMKKADLLVPSVSAASVIAKVARDEYMDRCSRIFAGYGWASNVGYGAAVHQTAITSLGVTPLHRMSFAPMKAIEAPLVRSASIVTTKTIGDKAELEAVRFLELHGYRIIERNWKTKWCEIDIIATKEGVTYFAEVKYRRSDAQGGGIAAITVTKLRQMEFAARLWLQKQPEADARLAAIEVTGENFEVTQFIDEVRR